MTTTKQDFLMYAGDDVPVDFTILDPDGDPLDLTGAVLTWRLARSDRRVALVTKTSADVSEIEVLSALGGTARLHLVPDDTSSLVPAVYQHSLRLLDADGETETLLTGSVTIRASLVDPA